MPHFRHHPAMSPDEPAAPSEHLASVTPILSDITPPGMVVSFEDDDDRAYRQFVESHRPEVAP